MYHCNNFYWLVFICLTLFFLAWFGLTSCIVVWKNLFQYITRKHEKETFWLFLVTFPKEEKNVSSITRSLYIRTTTKKNWVDLISRPTKQEKKWQLQKTYILRKSAQKLKSICTKICWPPSIKRLHITTPILPLKINQLIYGLLTHKVHLGISSS